MNYELVIWLEIHIKLNSPNKLFCKCKNQQQFGDLEANSNICPVCTWQPGSLPVLNKEPLEKAILLGLALDCDVNEISMFDRKSYFYPDLPMGYQITQLHKPTNTDGNVNFFIDSYQKKMSVRIQQAHIEADAGKTIHEWWKARLDYNRAATPLVEIVTYPDFRSDEEAIEFLKELQRIVRYNNIWGADLEKWQMRCDVNVSIREEGMTELWNRVELKNMNSFSAIRRAISHEKKRQIKIVEAGKPTDIDQETRGWNDIKGSSYTMRSKEEALDYRYFPEPDLPPLEIKRELVEDIKKQLVDSPFRRVEKYKGKYNFHKEFINPLIQDRLISDYFEHLVEEGVKPKTAVKWVVNILLRQLKDNNISIEEVKFPFEYMLNLLKKLDKGDIIEAQAKEVFKIMWKENKDPLVIIEEKGFKPQDSGELEIIVKKVLENNPKVVEDIKGGNMNAIWFLVGQVMKESRGQANPKSVNELIQKLLK